jgi:hypothetical protein
MARRGRFDVAGSLRQGVRERSAPSGCGQINLSDGRERHWKGDVWLGPSRLCLKNSCPQCPGNGQARTDANDVVDGAHSAASECRRVVPSKQTTLRGAVHGRG